MVLRILLLVMVALGVELSAQTGARVDRIQRRGALGCGVEPAVPGFAEVDTTGRYRGFDIDICRAVAAAVLGSADKVTYVSAPSVADFLRDDRIDLVSRRLTWELRREGSSGLLFGPITFFDGQGFLVSKTLAIDLARQLAGVPICVAGGSNFELNLGAYFSSQGMPLQKVVLESAHDYSDVAARLNDGRCRVYSGDLSDLGAIRSMTAQPDRFLILPNLISKEPLAPIVRSDDAQFFGIVRWTVFALISAEELGVTSANADDMRTSENLDVRRLLGVVPGNGNALGLGERWAYQAIKDVGNYGEVFDRNLGSRSRIRLDRGFNRLARDGGLMYAPPLR